MNTFLKLGYKTILIASLCMNVALAQTEPKPRIAPPIDQQALLPVGDTGAEILNFKSNAVWLEDGHTTRTTYVSVRINDLEAARDYGRISISYNHYYGETALDFANVYTNRGELKSVSEDAIQVSVTGGGQDFYTDRSSINFSLPEVEAGAIIEFQYSYKSIKIPFPQVTTDYESPHWWQETSGGTNARLDPVKQFEYQLLVPSDQEIIYRSYNFGDIKPDITRTEDGVAYVWSETDIAEIKLESSMPILQEVIPRVEISTSTDWSLMDDWASPKYEQASDPSHPEIQSLARQLLATGADSDEEKIKAVYEYMQNNIRYVYAHLGRGGYEPHPAPEVITQGYGDCKDQTVLGLALLKAMGVEAYPVLVQTLNRGRSERELVSQLFDHVLIWIPETSSRDAIWMDTTGDRMLFPGMSQYLLNQTAFIVDGKGGDLRTADFPYKENMGKLTLNYEPSLEGKSLVRAEILTSGYLEENLRSWWKHDSNRDSSLKQFMNGIFDYQGQYDLTAEARNVEDLFQPIEFSGVFEFDRETISEADNTFGANVTTLFSLFSSLNGLQEPELRVNRFIDEHPLKMQLIADFVPPEDASSVVLAYGSEFESDYFKINQNGSYDGDTYRIEIDVTRPVLDVPVDQYEQFRNDYYSVSSGDSWLVKTIENLDKENLQALSELKETSGENTAAYQIQLARNHIDLGEFEAALEPAGKAVEIDRQDGEAWYVLGMAQGYNFKLKESNISFEEARKLGYTP